MDVVDIVSIGFTALALVFLAAQASADSVIQKRGENMHRPGKFKVKK